MESVVVKDSPQKAKPPPSREKLKILWFTTSPSLSRASLDGSYNIGTSWIEAMESLVQEYTDIELSIAFIWKCDKVESFEIGQSSTRYYKMPRRPRNKVHNFLRLFFCQPEPKKGVEDYLNVVDAVKPDLIHFFGTENPFPMVLDRIDIPHVIWFQGNLTVYLKKWFAGISAWQALVSESLKNFVLARTDYHSYVSTKKFAKREKRIFEICKNFIGRTAWDRRLVRTMAPHAKYHHCDEVMRLVFHQNKWRPAKNRSGYVLVSTFRDNLYKGLETAMSAYKILCGALDKPLQWRIIGVPQDSHYERVCRRKALLNKGDHGFQILGTKSADEMIAELLDADMFVHPSHIDNSPNSVCEAMMLGMPIVSTNVGGVPSILKDKKQGLLVQNGDEFAMAGAILELLDDTDRAARFGAAARDRAMIRNDRKKIITELLDIYERIISASEVSATI